MIFQNPWAWMALAGVAIPVLIHLLARRPARRLPFPTTRFLPAARLTPVQRGRPSDWLLLAVRSAIVASAVAALSQPLWMTAARGRDRDRQLARAIIVDTSRSMERPTAAGEPGAIVAQREAQRIAGEATRSRIGASASPASLIEGAIRWLDTQPMRRELVVISDFQLAALSPSDLDRVPDDIGRTMIPIALSGAVVTSGSTSGLEIQLLAGEGDRADAMAARDAALATGAPATGRRDRPVAVLFPRFELRDSWLRDARPLSHVWMFDAANRIASDALVRGAADRLATPVAKAVQFVTHPIDGVDALVVVANTAPHTVLAAATLSAAMSAAADVVPAAELSPTVWSVEQLKSVERPAGESGREKAGVPGDRSDGRWFWIAAVVLLVVESVIRRSRASVEVPHARVA
jgi:hypothetical protein